MPQFLIEKNIQVGEAVSIGGSDAHHIIDVLRLKAGDWIILSDGKGSRFRAEIKGIDKKAVSVTITERLPDIKSTGVTLAQAIIKHDRIETVIQKAVELGVACIKPYFSGRTIPKYSDGVSAKKIERWNKIAAEASKQSGLPIRPEVRPPVFFEGLIKSAEGYRHKLMFYEGEGQNTVENYFRTVGAASERRYRGTEAAPTIIVIGPEGGFAADEVKLAREYGFTTLKLGPLIMRVETAALSALTLTQYFLGYFD